MDRLKSFVLSQKRMCPRRKCVQSSMWCGDKRDGGV